jgi:hypothetical protein
MEFCQTSINGLVWSVLFLIIVMCVLILISFLFELSASSPMLFVLIDALFLLLIFITLINIPYQPKKKLMI